MRRRLTPRRLGVLLALVVAGAAALGAVQGTTAAWTDQARVTASAKAGMWRPFTGQLRLAGTSLCLDIPNRDYGSNLSLQLYACNSTPAQVWNLPTGNQRIQVYTVGRNAPGDVTALCLLRSGATVLTGTCTNGAAGSWQTLADAAGGYRLQSNAAGTCIDAASATQGAAVTLKTCSTADTTQLWVPELVTVSYA
ncbi:RICIN domain-containing protein [Cellulomonas massiliensis]|uniref:RICIN domain-containing protein n=1 Tax=Cellulomonas massiliensis TaxID=1465811 RepID=UPI0002E071A8|nr:ricin-type beta-trefoil lectin domain protein [Cellulomonas massiliensis]